MEIMIDNREIVQTECTKFLGVYVDRHLQWNEHITHVSKKLAKNISVLSRIKHYLTKPVLRQLYYTQWNEHITHVSKKLAKNISVLSRIKHYLTKPVLRQLYYTLFFPYLSYCNICWGSNYSSRLKRLETLPVS